MHNGGGAQKGAGFEREICVKLSLWITKGKRRDCLWRSSMSGGRATVGLRKGYDLSRQAGDICAISPEGLLLTNQYYFECKFRKNIQLERFVVHNEGSLAEWWKKACQEAKAHNREPILIAKGNRMPVLVVTLSGSRFNPKPLAHLPKCDIGILGRILREKFVP